MLIPTTYLRSKHTVVYLDSRDREANGQRAHTDQMIRREVAIALCARSGQSARVAAGGPGGDPIIDIVTYRLPVFSPTADLLIAEIVALGGRRELQDRYGAFYWSPPTFKHELGSLHRACDRRDGAAAELSARYGDAVAVTLCPDANSCTMTPA